MRIAQSNGKEGTDKVIELRKNVPKVPDDIKKLDKPIRKRVLNIMPERGADCPARG